MYVHAGAFGAATVGFGAAVVGKNKFEIAADALVEGWKEQATTEGNFKDPEVFLEKLAAHEEQRSCKIHSSLLREHILLIVICLERNVSPLSKLFWVGCGRRQSQPRPNIYTRAIGCHAGHTEINSSEGDSTVMNAPTST